MGLDYSYEIFMPSWNVARALTRLAELAPRGRKTPPLPVTLPGGEQLLVPFTSKFKSEPVDCSSGGSLELDTSIVVGVDDAVREFFLRDSDRVDEQGRVSVGYIYLTIRFSCMAPELCVTAVHSRYLKHEPDVRTVRERQEGVHRPYRHYWWCVLPPRHRDRHLRHLLAQRRDVQW